MDLEFTGSIPVEAASTESTASKLSCFCDLHGLLIRTWESLVLRVLRVHEIVGSNPTVLTGASRTDNDMMRWPPCWYGRAAVNRADAGSIPAAAALRKGKPTGDGAPLEPE